MAQLLAILDHQDKAAGVFTPAQAGAHGQLAFQAELRRGAGTQLKPAIRHAEAKLAIGGQWPDLGDGQHHGGGQARRQGDDESEEDDAHPAMPAQSTRPAKHARPAGDQAVLPSTSAASAAATRCCSTFSAAGKRGPNSARYSPTEANSARQPSRS